ncbi:unnamed protein product [Schistosoma curassoni]|uniref:Uncharacterized protein n=1 Tax=Schistosoma curassoni TaxID=6186 RepID=A0A183KZP6_9TREM|nr:unnamed protein product [Schistosoma curassoni]
MVVEGSRQETLDAGFVLLGTRQQGVPVILRGPALPEGFDPKQARPPRQGSNNGRENNVITMIVKFKQNKKMVVGGSRQETLDAGFVLLGTRQQGVPVILRGLVLPGRSDLVSPSFTDREVTTELSEPRPTSCRTKM